MFAVALMSTSCCKDDPIVPDGTLTESNLQGVWVSDSYTINGTTYDANDCPAGEYMLITMNINNELVGQVDDNCNSTNHLFVDVLFGDDEISLDATLGGYTLTFDVVSYVNDGGTETLTLLLTYKSSYFDDTPEGGTYVLVKQ